MNILMVAAENGALPGGKVGGIGDVIREMPTAMSRLGHRVHIVTPGYQRFSKLPAARRVAVVEVSFRSVSEYVELFQLSTSDQANVSHWVLEHSLFASCGAGTIYCNDEPGNPFAIDASKFALFCAAVSQCCIDGSWGELDVIHLHDWHAALVALLIRFAPQFHTLSDCRLVYTIHNLFIQGIRPITDDLSSLKAWFPELSVQREWVIDPRYPQCINPMRLAINLCDKVHAVSPTYAKEIQLQSDPGAGFFGGEGLEDDLKRAAVEGRLEGILNGCEYPDDIAEKFSFEELLNIAESQLLQWIAASEHLNSRNLLALRRLDQWRSQLQQAQTGILITFVARITDQKLSLLLQSLPDGRLVLEHLLDNIPAPGRMILLGSGDKTLEQHIVQVAARYNNLLFLCGYSDELSESLYRSGDLFLMPSSFEPCGISQMLAMRSGQPCLVHHVGGLVDTVRDGDNGFSFDGVKPQQQTHSFIHRFTEVMSLYQKQPAMWQAVRTRAAQSRFLWDDVAKEYVSKLYQC